MSNTACQKSSIAGASFSIHPMSDDFVTIILRALEEVDTSKVWLQTDDVTTTVRGKFIHVFDVTKALFLHAAKTGKHVAFQATYSFGCPGDSEGDVFLAEDDIPANESFIKEIEQHAAAKFSLYPLGGGNYMDIIYEQIEAMKRRVDVSPAHFSTRLAGDTHALFAGLQDVFQTTIHGGSNHTVMTVSISANSPSHTGGQENAR